MSDPNPTPELHGLDPGELLARALQTAPPSSGTSAWAPPAPEEVARLLPQYRIESLIGRGGMGAVYKGVQLTLDRTVAIKLLPVEVAADAQFVTRFEREARTLARLQHSRIVTIHDFGRTSAGHLYFVMEYIDGTDLRSILRGPGLDPEQALAVVGQLCDALQAAHREGVVHRDIKPENVLITRDGYVKLADFGLARPPEEAGTSALTNTNVVMGTPDYMAPEQRVGATHADHRSDIFALGVMLYEMLTGLTPRGVFDPPSRKVRMDVRIDEVVLKALQSEPERRYQKVSEMKTDVDRIRTTPLEPVIAVASAAPAPPLTANRPRSFGLAAVIVALLCVVGFFVWEKIPVSPAPLSASQTPATPPPFSSAAVEPRAELVLAPARPVRVGSGKEERIGFAQPGPVVRGPSPNLRVPVAREQAVGLKITRLYWTNEDSIPGPSTGAARARQLGVWLPRKTGPFCDAVPSGSGSATASIVTPTRPLPDGAYCLHSGVLKAGADTPAFSGLFVIYGLAKLALVNATATWKDGVATLALTIRNEGPGEFNEGRLVVTLQQETGGRSKFIDRWEPKIPTIPHVGGITFTQSYPSAKWEPAAYHFSGHLGLDHVAGDTEGEIFDFTSPTFTVPSDPAPNPSPIPAATAPAPSPGATTAATSIPTATPVPALRLLPTFSKQIPNISAWVLAPLEQSVPADIRQNLTFLREDLVDEAKRQPAASAAAYQAGAQLCNTLLAILDERTQTQARAGFRGVEANARTGVTSQALEARRNYMMSWPQYAREESQRAELKSQALNNAAIIAERPKLEWSQRAAQLSKMLDALYAQFRAALRQK